MVRMCLGSPYFVSPVVRSMKLWRSDDPHLDSMLGDDRPHMVRTRSDAVQNHAPSSTLVVDPGVADVVVAGSEIRSRFYQKSPERWLGQDRRRELVEVVAYSCFRGVEVPPPHIFVAELERRSDATPRMIVVVLET